MQYHMLAAFFEAFLLLYLFLTRVDEEPRTLQKEVQTLILQAGTRLRRLNQMKLNFDSLINDRKRSTFRALTVNLSNAHVLI